MQDYADKRWLRKHRRPVWHLIARRFCARVSRPTTDVLPRGVHIQLRGDGCAYIIPAPVR